MSYRIVLAASFLESIKRLKRKYPQANADAKIALQVLIENPLLGVMISGGGGARKVRVRNSDLRRGKSGGYRLVYFVDGANKSSNEKIRAIESHGFFLQPSQYHNRSRRFFNSCFRFHRNAPRIEIFHRIIRFDQHRHCPVRIHSEHI